MDQAAQFGRCRPVGYYEKGILGLGRRGLYVIPACISTSTERYLGKWPSGLHMPRLKRTFPTPYVRVSNDYSPRLASSS